MPALNFKAQFAPAVTAGTKPHTIRAWRKRPFRRGDDLSFFTGMRTKNCRRLRPNTPCLGATMIEIDGPHRRVFLDGSSLYYPQSWPGMLALEMIEQLAKADGFDSLDAFFAWFTATHGPVFVGQLIEWDPTHV